MKNYELILFDLDGTLTDPGEGITNSVAYALRKFEIDVADRSELYRFIGPPLVNSFMSFYGFSREQAKQAVTFYREYYTEKGMMENLVYDGIEDMLKALNAAGKRLCVATSKPEPFAKTILEHFGLSKYFEYIAGATLEETRTKKHEVIKYALEKCRIKDNSRVLMVGDREHDVLGAAKYSIDSLGVLFGYGTRKELEEAGVTYIAENVEDIISLIIN